MYFKSEPNRDEEITLFKSFVSFQLWGEDVTMRFDDYNSFDKFICDVYGPALLLHYGDQVCVCVTQDFLSWSGTESI
jgi:hypothetical protein